MAAGVVLKRVRLPRSVFGRTLGIAMVLHLVVWAGMTAAARDVGWSVTWLLVSAGSALMIACGAQAIDTLAFCFGGLVRPMMRTFGTLGFGLGWLFSFVGGALVAFHPVMLIYILYFGSIGLGVGLAAGFVVGVVAELADWAMFRRRVRA
jgi:hypothetical protein